MSSSEWTMRARLGDSGSPKLLKLNEDIRTWEKGFELEFRRPAKRDDVLLRPFISTPSPFTLDSPVFFFICLI